MRRGRRNQNRNRRRRENPREDEVQVDENPREDEVQVDENPREDEVQVDENPREDEVQVDENPREDEVQVDENPREDEVQVDENPREDEVQVDENVMQNMLHRIQDIFLPPRRPDVIPPMEVMQLEQEDVVRQRDRYCRRVTLFVVLCLIILIIALYIWYILSRVSFKEIFSFLFPKESKEKSDRHGEGGLHQ
ncbi:hypothetical protein TNCV_480741 [Trichonephila clavipes]|nr:hypothetical protein TNCV_480741 [Trichonephila clavipes]